MPLTCAAVRSLARPAGLVAASTAGALAGVALWAWVAGEELPDFGVDVSLIAAMVAVCLLVLLPAPRLRFGNR